MNNNWEEEFDKKFVLEETFSRSGFNGMAGGGVFKNVRNDLYGIKNFISALLDQREAEIRKEYEGKYLVSWDIADGGKEWCILIWKVNKDGTRELWQELNKDSDDGGNFEIPVNLFEIRKETIEAMMPERENKELSFYNGVADYLKDKAKEKFNIDL